MHSTLLSAATTARCCNAAAARTFHAPPLPLPARWRCSYQISLYISHPSLAWSWWLVKVNGRLQLVAAVWREAASLGLADALLVLHVVQLVQVDAAASSSTCTHTKCINNK
jgi:hypothetical protein